LLSASIPLAATLTSVILALTSDRHSKTVLRNPTLTELQSADSVHVLGFTSHGELLIAESEGSFTLEDWDDLYEVAKGICCDGIETSDDDDAMQDEISDEKASEAVFLKSILREKVATDLHWKE
jgi:exosome complex component RRP46